MSYPLLSVTGQAIRQPEQILKLTCCFTAAFVVLLLLSAFIGLAPHGQVDAIIPTAGDRFLHFVVFFLLSVVFYWVVETTRRRALQLTLTTCTFVLGVGSEILQDTLPNGRAFDVYDILANLLGSVSAALCCAWYHRRMLERKRRVGFAGDSGGTGGYTAAGDEDMELGETTRSVGAEERQPLHTISSHESGQASGQESGSVTRNELEREVDNWDENVVGEESWEDYDSENADGFRGPTSAAGGEEASNAAPAAKKKERND